MPAEQRSSVLDESMVERVPGWEAFPWLRAGFSIRQGGASFAFGHAEQNLGWTSEDVPEAVAANRRGFVAAVAPDAHLELVTVRQVHGKVVRNLDRESHPWMLADGKARLEGDGLISSKPGMLLAILTADCVPVLVADIRTHAVAAFHAGWRGTLAGIVATGIAAMGEQFGTAPEDLIAAIGPSIRSCCFEVGPEVRDAFGTQFGGVEQFFTASPVDTLHMDLVEANRAQLCEAGLIAGSIQVVGGCTACDKTAGGKRRYFSYRAEQGRTGRMLSGIAALA